MEIRILDSRLVKPCHEELTNFDAYFVPDTIVSLAVISLPKFLVAPLTLLSILSRITFFIPIWNSKVLKPCMSSSLLFIVVIQTIVSFIPVSLFKILKLTPLKFLVVPLTPLTILWSPGSVVLMRT